MRTRPLLALAALLALLSCSSSSPSPSSTGTGGAAVEPDAGQAGAAGAPKLCTTPADSWCASDADCPAAPSPCVAWRCNVGGHVVVPGVRCGCYTVNVCDGGAVPGCIDDAGAYRSATCQDSLDCGEAHACGHNGGACVDCEDHNPCTDDQCALSGCAHYVWLGKTCGKGGVCLDDGGCSQ